MKKFLCVMLFVVCLCTLGACSTEGLPTEVVNVLDLITTKFNAFVEFCRPYCETAIANISGFISGVMGK